MSKLSNAVTAKAILRSACTAVKSTVATPLKAFSRTQRTKMIDTSRTGCTKSHVELTTSCAYGFAPWVCKVELRPRTSSSSKVWAAHTYVNRWKLTRSIKPSSLNRVSIVKDYPRIFAHDITWNALTAAGRLATAAMLERMLNARKRSIQHLMFANPSSRANPRLNISRTTFSEVIK